MSSIDTSVLCQCDTHTRNDDRDSFIVEGLDEENSVMDLDSTVPYPQASGSPITSVLLLYQCPLPVTLPRQIGRGVSELIGKMEQQWTQFDNAVECQSDLVKAWRPIRKMCI